MASGRPAAGALEESADCRSASISVPSVKVTASVEYDARLAAARCACADPDRDGGLQLGPGRTGRGGGTHRDVSEAAAALFRLAVKAQACRTDWALGIEARSRALLSDGDDAEALFRAAIDHLGRARVRAELARAHLLYGNRLRRVNRRVDARRELTLASEMFTAMGTEGFAERARRELQAGGATVRGRAAGTFGQLTAQEAVIARLARDGLSNAEIGTQLFISTRTVEWHLRQVFAKLGISARGS